MNENNTQSEKLSAYAPRVQKIRDFVSGEVAVKSKRDLYMPVPSAGMDPLGTSFSNFLRRTSFFPGASRVHDGCLSLVFQKDPVLVSERVQPIKNVITRDGDSLEILAEKIVSETLLSNYTGILVDHPSDEERPANLNAANALELGFRPFLSVYPFESILHIEKGIVGLRQALTLVRLSDNANQYRELTITNGVYTVTIFTKNVETGEWSKRSYVPRRGGKPLDFIPFKIVTTKKTLHPTKSLLEDVVHVNCNHFITAGELAQAINHCAGPQKVAINPGKQLNPDGTEKAVNEYPAGSEYVLEVWGENSDFKYLEFTGTGVSAIRGELVELKNQMAALGSRILQDEKAAPEAAEALSIRRTSENATIVGVARTVALDMEWALRVMAWWMGAESKEDPDTRFMLNVDLVPAKLTPQEVAEIRNLRASGAYTAEEEFYALRDGGWHADTLTWEAHKAKIDAEVIDQPIATVPAGEI